MEAKAQPFRNETQAQSYDFRYLFLIAKTKA
jgi:hypothetical protein